jgi:hypothetical protein
MIGWFATAAIVIATSIRAVDYSHTLDLIFTLIGGILWGYEGYRLNNKPLIIVNAFCSAAMIVGLFL